jgi:hypothetical protein
MNDRELTAAIVNHAASLFHNHMDDRGQIATGTYNQVWSGLGIALAMGDDGQAFLMISEGEVEADGLHLRVLFEATWKAGEPCLVPTWHRGSWEDAFIKAVGE